MSQTTNRPSKTGFLVRVALLSAIIAVMAFTPLGYFRTGFLSITLLPIPVVIGAIVLGPTAGAILGAVFGVTSVIQCFGLEPFGTALMGINPIGTLITCMAPRILMGFLTGGLFAILRRLFHNRFGVYVAACLAGPVLNTLLFMTSLSVFFYHTDFIQNLAGGKNVLAFCVAFVGVNGAVEAAACCLLGAVISKALCSIPRKQGE